MLVALSLVLAAPPEPPKPVPLAALSPPGVVAAVELPRVGPLREAASRWLGDAVLADPLAAVATPGPAGELSFDQRLTLGWLSMLFSRQALPEWDRCEGAALFVHGAGGWTLVIRTGADRVLPLAVRGALTASPLTRGAGTRGRAQVFQMAKMPERDDDAPPVPVKRPGELNGPDALTVALAPGLIVVGPRLDPVHAALDLAEKPGKSPTLADDAEYKAARTLVPADAGFLFLRPPPGVADAPLETLPAALARFLAPPPAARVVAGTFAAEGERFAVRLTVRAPAAGSGPLLALVAGPAAPSPGVGVGETRDGLTLRPADGPGRAARVLAVLDAASAALGSVGPSASDMVQKLPGIAPDLDTLTGVTLERGGLGELAVLLRLTPESAPRLRAVLPKAAARAAGTGAVPVAETVGGVRVETLALPTAAFGPNLVCAAAGDRLAVAGDRATVLALLKRPAGPASADALSARLYWARRLAAGPPPENASPKVAEALKRLAAAAPLELTAAARGDALELTLAQPGVPALVPALLDWLALAP